MTGTNRAAYFINKAGANQDGFRVGLDWLEKTSQASSASNVWIVVPVKDNVRGIIRDVVGDTTAQALLNDQPVVLGKSSRTQVKLVTQRTLPYRGPSGPVLAVYPTATLLTKLDTLDDISAIAVVPWTMEEITPWIQKWQARDFLLTASPASAATTPQLRLSNPVVEQALLSLTHRVNLSTGLGHQRDKDAAVWMFRKLRAAKEDVDFGQLPAWLVAHGWRSDDADRLMRLGSDIYAGKRLQAGQDTWRSDILKQWQERARDMDQTYSNFQVARADRV